MDALMVDKGDPWNPSTNTVEQTHRMCSEISRVLAPGGVYIQLSFEQPHFRSKLLRGQHHHVPAAPGVVDTSARNHTLRDEKYGVVNSSRGEQAEDDGVKTDDGSQPPIVNQGLVEEPAAEDACLRLGDGRSVAPYGWDVRVHEIQRESGCFGHFLYVMRKQSKPGA